MCKLSQFLIVLGLIFLTACTSYQAMLQRKQDTAICLLSCQQARQVCQQACLDNCPRCMRITQQSTLNRYRHYQTEQNIQGEFVRRQLQSYRDPLQCRKMTCDCTADYRVCAQSCTGVIRKHLQIGQSCC